MPGFIVLRAPSRALGDGQQRTGAAALQRGSVESLRLRRLAQVAQQVRKVVHGGQCARVALPKLRAPAPRNTFRKKRSPLETSRV